jgi:tRNA A37 methylthiotransferase MiaB
VRSNVIVGFPGETEDDLAMLEAFLTEARLDAIGVFGYSEEDGTEAATFADVIDPDEVAARVDRVAGLADTLVSERARERLGDDVHVLVTEPGIGLSEHQGPDVDGVTVLSGPQQAPVGAIVTARVVSTDGVDLTAQPIATP